MKKLLKILHTIGACGVSGTLAGLIVLSWRTLPSEELAELSRHMATLTNLVLLPSLGLVLISGLLSIAAYRPFVFVGWVWVKALLGLSMFEGTLVGVIGPAEQLAVLSADGNNASDQAVAGLLRHLRGALWVILAVSLANIVIGVWRPKIGWKPAD